MRFGELDSDPHGSPENWRSECGNVTGWPTQVKVMARPIERRLAPPRKTGGSAADSSWRSAGHDPDGGTEGDVAEIVTFVVKAGRSDVRRDGVRWNTSLQPEVILQNRR